MTTTVASGAGARKTRTFRLSGTARIWLLNAVLGGSALVLYLTVVRGLPEPATAYRIPWWVLALLFCASELAVINVQFRRDAHSISLGEIPFVLGLFFVAPGDFVVAQFVGAVLALSLWRRQSALKLAFNVSHFCLEACLAVLLFSLVPAAAVLGPAGWTAALAGTTLATLMAVVAMFAAISLSEGRAQFGGLGEALMTAGAFNATNTSIALLGVWVLAFHPPSVWLLVAPAATLFAAYRAWIRERDRSERLRFLYDVTSEVSAAPEIETAVLALLAHARVVFRADIAELTLYPGDPADPPLRTTLGPDESERVMAPVASVPPEDRHRASRLLPAPVAADDAARHLDGRPFKDAMLAPLTADGHVFGELLVADRGGEVSTFDLDDLELLETLATQASVCLENGRLEKSLAQLTVLKEQLRHQAFHDSLTGLVNRELFRDRVEHALAAQRRTGTSVIVLLLDLDDFKTVNDSLGHAAGDQLLVEVAARLSDCLRPGDTAARLGGDEFAVLVADVDGMAPGIVVAERILGALQHPVLLHGLEATVHASIGIARSVPGDDAATLLRNADVAMYEAKQEGKNRYGLYERGMHHVAVERLELRGQLQTAVDHDEFSLRYQPLVDLETGEVVGAEALVRWNHPTRGLLAPEAFIGYAEESGLIVPVGAWVLEHALAQCATWQRELPGRQGLSIAVNLSARQLTHPRLLEDVVGLLRRHALSAGSVVLEITESVLIRDTPATLRALRSLKALGARIAIDDFGTGYSALSYLRQFPIDMLKISKPFVDDVRRGGAERAVTDAIIHLAEALGLHTVAEGVEHPEQVVRLRDMGCTLAQGFHFAQPLPAEAFTELLHGQGPPGGLAALAASRTS